MGEHGVGMPLTQQFVIPDRNASAGIVASCCSRQSHPWISVVRAFIPNFTICSQDASNVAFEGLYRADLPLYRRVDRSGFAARRLPRQVR